MERVCPPKLCPMDAPFVRNNGPAAIMSRFLSCLLDTSLAHAIGFIQTQVLGPETGWSKWKKDLPQGISTPAAFYCGSKCTQLQEPI